MVYQDATGLYHFLINVIPFISNSVVYDNYRYLPISHADESHHLIEAGP